MIQDKLKDLSKPVLVKDSHNDVYRVRADSDENNLPVVVLEKFVPKHWNTSPEDAKQDDFVHIGAWESQDPDDILESIQDEIGDVTALD